MNKKRSIVMGLLGLCIILAFWAAYRIMDSGADIEYLLWLQGLRQNGSYFLTSMMCAVTRLGESTIPVALGSILFWCVDKKAGERMLLLGVLGTWVNQLIKVTACVYRPWVRDARITPVPEALETATGYSFPSGHTANAGAWLMGLGAWAKETRPGKGARAALMCGLGFIWILVGFSRNFLGVHTPQDVGVMLLLMCAVMLSCNKCLSYAAQGGKQESIVAACGVAMGVLLALWASVKSYPLDYDAAGSLLVDPAKLTIDTFKTAGMTVGFFTGWLCERRIVRFSVEGAVWSRLLRGAAGVVLLLALEKLLSIGAVNIMGVLWGQFAAKTALFLFITVGYPSLIRALQNVGRKGNAAG